MISRAALAFGQIEIVRTFLAADASPVDYHGTALAYWNDKRGGRLAPAWTDISLMDLPPRVIPLISVTDIIEEPFSSVFRFWGTKLTEIYGGDYSGKSPHLVPPKDLGLSISGGCGRLVQERKPHLEVKEFQTDRGTIGRAIVLRLPLSDDGVHVHHGINISYFEPATQFQPQSDFFTRVFASIDQ